MYNILSDLWVNNFGLKFDSKLTKCFTCDFIKYKPKRKSMEGNGFE